MTIYWGNDFGIRVVVLGVVIAAVGYYLGTVCTVGMLTPAGSSCVEYGFGGSWLILLSGIGLIVMGFISIATDRREV